MLCSCINYCSQECRENKHSVIQRRKMIECLNALLGHHRPQICSTLYFIGAHCVQMLLTSLVASARATRLLAILPYWLMSFALRGQEHFHCSPGEVQNTHCTWLAKQGLASLRSSKYVGVNGSAAIQCFIWLTIPSF